MKTSELEARLAGLPDVAPGHWDTPGGREMAAEYVVKDRSELMMGDMSDLHFANAQFLVSRNSLELIHFQTAAKERIRWLSARLAEAEALRQRIEALEAENGRLLEPQRGR